MNDPIFFRSREHGRYGSILWRSLLPLALAGCAPTVKINTPEPLKVDISMKVDVYEKGERPGATHRRLGDAEVEAMRRRDARSGEIWSMKNDRVAVENDRGYLDARKKAGWDAAYIDRLVTEENSDRRVLYEAEARDNGMPLASVEEMAGKRLRQQAYGRGP